MQRAAAAAPGLVCGQVLNPNCTLSGSEPVTVQNVFYASPILQKRNN